MYPNHSTNDLLIEPLDRLLESDGFFAATNNELLGVLENCGELEFELMSYAWCELVRRNKQGKMLIAERICEARDLLPIPWLASARNCLSYLNAPPRRNYTQSVYVILRTGYESDNGYGAYVGVTAKSPEARFREHSTPNHKRAARGLPEHAICLLTSLMHPYVRVPGRLKLQYETATHLALQAAGVRVSGDKQVDQRNWLPQFQPRLVELLELNGVDPD